MWCVLPCVIWNTFVHDLRSGISARSAWSQKWRQSPPKVAYRFHMRQVVIKKKTPSLTQTIPKRHAQTHWRKPTEPQSVITVQRGIVELTGVWHEISVVMEGSQHWCLGVYKQRVRRLIPPLCWSFVGVTQLHTPLPTSLTFLSLTTNAFWSTVQLPFSPPARQVRFHLLHEKKSKGASTPGF